MTRKATVLILLILAFSALGCRGRTDKSEGTVILSVSRFDGLPSTVSAATGPFSIGTININNVPKDPNGTTSGLQTVELRSYEVRYTRRDTGHRAPPTLVGGVFGSIAVSSQTTINNLPFLMSNQTQTPPLSDLTHNGADSETGTSVIVLDVTITFFGRTLAGDDVASAPSTFTIEVRP